MALCNTIFHQMLKFIPRHHFAKLETEPGTGRKARSFTRWSQSVHLLSMQLTARVSLRDAVSSLKACIKSLYHLGVKPVPRSTVADANNQRPAFFSEARFRVMCRRCQPLTPQHKFTFKNKPFSLDATVVSLCLALYPGASFRRTKGGIKLHPLLGHDGVLPAFVAVSPAREPDIKKARSLSRRQIPGMPHSPAPHRLPGRRHRQALCLSHQPFKLAAKTIADINKER